MSPLPTVALSLTILTSLSAAAQPAPKINSVAPSLVARGGDTELTFSGEHLDAVRTFHVSGPPGLSAVVLPEPGPDGTIPDAQKPPPNQRKVRLTVAPDAPLGDREIRLDAPAGVSNPLPLVVGLLPEVPEREPNGAPASAMAFTPPAVITGAIAKEGETDHYRFTARKGDRLTFNVYASRIGSKLDGSLALYAIAPPSQADLPASVPSGAGNSACECKSGCACPHCKSGGGQVCGCGGPASTPAPDRAVDVSTRELARSEDANGLDPFLDFDAPSDGDYIVALRDYMHRGAGDYTYRLEVGNAPYIRSIYPLGGPRGSTVDVAVEGVNLDGVATHRILLPADAPPGRRDIRIDTPRGPSPPVPFDVGDVPEVSEEEFNDTLEGAQVIKPPVIVNGRIGDPGDTDTFLFDASGHTHLVCEVLAQRYGSPLDAILTLTDFKGARLALDDDGAGPDARIDFSKFAARGQYVLALRDLVGRGGPRFAYRLSIRPPTPPAAPDFAVRFQPDTLRVSRGSHARVWCEVTRRNGFAGDVTARFDDLPPGVTCDPLVLPNGTPPGVFFTIAAAPDAPTGTVPVRFTASAKIGDRDAVRVAVAETVEARDVRTAFLTVLDTPAFTVEPVGGAPGGERDAKLAELAEVEKALNTSTPELDAAQAEWEKSLAASGSWVVVKVDKTYGYSKPTFATLDDGSILVSGPNPAKTNYSVEARTDLKRITAVRLEALTDPSLPQSGPGRVGNFVLSEFGVLAAPAADPNAAAAPLAIAGVTADHSQGGFPVEHTIDGKPETGWAVHPEIGRPHAAVYVAKTPFVSDGGARCTFNLEHQSMYASHALGRFRISVTDADAPSRDLPTHPAAVRLALDTPADKRTDAQKNELAAHYRSFAPALAEARNRAARLRAESGEFPPRAERDKPSTLGVAIRRNAGFTGDVEVTLEGFSSGRDPATRRPFAITKNIEVAPVVLKEGQTHALLTFKPLQTTELGTRHVVLRAEAPVNGVKAETYSRAFPLAVQLVRIDGPPREPDNPAGLVGGLAYAYFEGDWEKLPDFAALPPVKSGASTAFEITSRNREDRFGYVFTGFLNAPREGDYIFYTKSDDGSRLLIGDKVVVENDGLHGPELKSGPIKLKAGHHAITVLMFEREGGEFLEVSWEGPEIPKQPIPAAQLFRRP